MLAYTNSFEMQHFISFCPICVWCDILLYRNIDDVDKTMDEINEQTENMKQIQEALSAPIGAAADFDEACFQVLVLISILFILWIAKFELFHLTFSGWIGSRTWRTGRSWVGGTASSACYYCSCSSSQCTGRQATNPPCCSEEQSWGRWACCITGRDGTLRGHLLIVLSWSFILPMWSFVFISEVVIHLIFME